MNTKTPQAAPAGTDTGVATDAPGSSRREFLGQSGRVAAGVGVAALVGNLGQYALSYAAGGPPIKIGVLHSLSGTMAISEVSLRDVVLMAVEEINKAGGGDGPTGGGESRRSRVELGPLRRKSQAAAVGRQSVGGVRLLDVGQPQIRVAGV
ncbi:hypothetical protein COMA2_260002 [Candidatus Nitrospira nitrificans]|uniref:Leucine-binding protein domain-containing protein n=1 Tax=Candidatus Nitrospira nitrificans TaxID=1742973 RepID=A0A0S4LLD9_9BACT|nr:hypothetical protein COMA2_260002 [Candidatus Nitrospira nitrificans]